MEATELLLQPVVQYGFLGFSAVLLGIIVWLIKRLLSVIEANNNVIAENTAAMKMLTSTVSDMMLLSRSIHDKLISRPCIARMTKDSDRHYQHRPSSD